MFAISIYVLLGGKLSRHSIGEKLLFLLLKINVLFDVQKICICVREGPTDVEHGNYMDNITFVCALPHYFWLME